MNKGRKLYEAPIATFAENYLLAQGIKYPLDEYQKAYLDIKQKGHSIDEFYSLRYVFSTLLLDIIVEEFATFKTQRNRDYYHKIKKYNERKRK